MRNVQAKEQVFSINWPSASNLVWLVHLAIPQAPNNCYLYLFGEFDSLEVQGLSS